MDIEQKLTALFQSEQFKKAAENVQTAEELQALFAENGVELTQKEVLDLCAGIAAQMEEAELDEYELENVAGGFGLLTATVFALGAACIGVLAGTIYDNAMDKGMLGEREAENHFRNTTNYFGGELKPGF